MTGLAEKSETVRPGIDDLRFEPTPFQRVEGVFATVRAEMDSARPALIHCSPEMAARIGWGEVMPDENAIAEAFSGKVPPAQSLSLAGVYAGHQFGVYVPQLGDGRALSFGQIETADGPLDLQLKGAGRTPFSRFGDGRAVMRSSIREYLCSEAMAALGVPTTRALCLVGTREAVIREKPEPGAIVTRASPAFLRFGHLEFFAHTGRAEIVQQICDLLIAHHYPDCAESDHADLFRQIVIRTAKLIALWQSVGFAHGVMNTDNMSLIGETIDYGPFGFLDAYDPGFICNHSDHQGRYAFGAQPNVALWNCQALAAALSGLVADEDLRAGLQAFAPAYHAAIGQAMRAKLALAPDFDEDDLLAGLMTLMAEAQADFTQTFRMLSQTDVSAERFSEHFGDRGQAANDWFIRWDAVSEPDRDARARRMQAANPKFILRNWVAETAIRAIEDRDDREMFDAIFRSVTNPFADDPIGDPGRSDPWAGAPPAALANLSVSCSS